MKLRFGFPSLFCTISIASAIVCPPATTDVTESWPFSVAVGTSYSCSSSAGGTNDLGTTPTPCEGDLASVRIQATKGVAECLVAAATECKIPMHDFVSLDYNFEVSDCMGVWAAPLWMTPDTWQWGGMSGEIDSLEFCSRDAVHTNFAGGGHEIALDPAKFSINDASGHVTVRKDGEGIVTIAACSTEEAAETGQCFVPKYNNCDECLSSSSFACWCNGAGNIYDSGGCTPEGNCMWTLVSDLWNGVKGDSGYAACMTEVPAIGLSSGAPNLNTTCALSVENLTLRGSGSDGSLRWGSGSPEYCSVLTLPLAEEK